MTRGRPRKRDKTIPEHIDQRKLPVGCYWDARDRVWYTIHRDPKPRRQKVAAADALMSDLHLAMEAIRGVNRKSLGWLVDQYHESHVFAALSERTRADYARQRAIVRTLTLKDGSTLASLDYGRLNTVFFQRLVDKIAGEGTPTKANHLMRYLRLVYSWAVRRGYVPANPVKGTKEAKERQQRRLPKPDVMAALVRMAYEGSQRQAHTEGSCPPYLWAVADIAYLCRLRGIEVVTLTEDHALEAGVRTNRRKGSRDNIVAWTPRLRMAWDALIRYRDGIWRKRGTPVPIRAEDRPLVVAAHGGAITKSGLDSAWQRIKARALAEKLLDERDWFGLHDLKRRGVTDTAGNRADKQEGSGHRTESMMDVYDLSLPVVPAAGSAKITP
ncbi:site-specific integrase [Luteibacter sp. NPDC031894]|uniref:site-specific integrase n=1 Tax=Luteibacter sp. NPDC031894 TaxID=3390572 RepID=UPI003D059A11